ncbi:MAG: hypothetical protein ACI9MR_000204 [Myxococcota bacterium]|jgi:hypothetical protein
MALTPYRRILDTCVPYLVAREPVVRDLDRSPLGIPLDQAHLFDPQVVRNGPFLELLKRLDELTYGARSLQMPSWVFYDCAVIPGAVFGFARPAAALAPWVRQTLQVPDDYDGLVPMSLFIAIPMAHREARLVYSLDSINQVASGAAPEGLWRLTLAAGTAALGIDVMVATVQWRSPRLALYASLGPLKVMTAWTPAHDICETATLYVFTDDAARERLLHGAAGTTQADRYLDADSYEEMAALQREIEEGLDVWVVGPPEIRGADTRIPLATTKPAAGAVRQKDTFRRRFQG